MQTLTAQTHEDTTTRDQIVEAQKKRIFTPARIVPGRWKRVLGTLFVMVATYLLLIGLLVTVAASAVVDRAIGDLQRNVGDQIVIYARDDADEGDVAAFRRDLAAMHEVSGVSFVSKEQALQRARELFADDPEMLQQLEGYPLPASFELKLKDPSQADAAAARIRASRLFQAVAGRGGATGESLQYPGQIARWRSQLTSVLRILGVLAAAAALLPALLGLGLFLVAPAPGSWKLVVGAVSGAVLLFLVTVALSGAAYLATQLGSLT